jgi:hypothetical protein
MSTGLKKKTMTQPCVAGGPLGVARADRPLGPRRRRHATVTRNAFMAAIAVVVRLLAGAAVVEAIAVTSVGLAAGTAIAVCAAIVMALVYFGHSRID